MTNRKYKKTTTQISHPWVRDTSLQGTKCWFPYMSIIEGFHCTPTRHGSIYIMYPTSTSTQMYTNCTSQTRCKSFSRMQYTLDIHAEWKCCIRSLIKKNTLCHNAILKREHYITRNPCQSNLCYIEMVSWIVKKTTHGLLWRSKLVTSLDNNIFISGTWLSGNVRCRAWFWDSLICLVGLHLNWRQERKIQPKIQE